MFEEILTQACNLYYNNLYKHPSVLNYLIKIRGLTPKIIRQFKLGYCSDNLLYNQVKKNCIDYKYAKDYNLISSKGDKFNGFIIFPVYQKNKTVFIYGRSFNNKNKKHKLLKNVPKKYLYNPDALNKDAIIITESAIDTLTLVQNGFNAVGLFGLQISNGVFELFKNKICYFLLDNDNAGISSAQTLSNKIFSIAKEVHILKFPINNQDKIDVNIYFSKVSNATNRIKFLLKNSVAIKVSPFRFKKNKIKKIFKEDNINIIEVGKKLFSDYEIKGNQLWIQCPFHKETKASFCIGGNKNIFYCYGCQVSGGAIKLVSLYLKISFYEAIEWLRKKFSDH